MLGGIVKSENGNLAASVVLSVIAIVSGLVMTTLIMGDSVLLARQADSIQAAHFLRTSLDRGSQILNTTEDLEKIAGVHEKRIVLDEAKNKIYTLKSEFTQVNEEGDIPIMNLSSYIESNNAERSKYHDFNPSAKYGEQLYEVESLADFVYFTDCDVSVNDDPVKFWGRDHILHGRVHSNTDIVITSSTRPYFGGFVTSGSQIIYDNGNPVLLNDSNIFGAGAAENVQRKVFPENADKIRENSTWIDCSQELTYIEVDDRNFIMCIAHITDLPPEEYIVYNSYPPYGLVGDSLFTNYIVFRDTSWTAPTTQTINNESVFVNSDLWIHGSFGGMQTWGCSGNMYLVGDITLENTVVGEAPDGYRESQNDFNGNVNTDDYVGLVSEGSIIIKYAYKNPVDSQIHWDNCGSENDMDSGIYIYAALAALGRGDGWEDGHFSYECHYPHPSTPHAYNWMNTNEDFMYPDLHLCRFTPDIPQHFWPWPANGGGGFNYPAQFNPGGGIGTINWSMTGAPDYPWYNPVFPSAKTKYERGFINLFGSVAQRRRGFVHRSGSDPLDSGYWDMDDPAHPMMGPSVNSTGYGKRYFYDTRFQTNPPVNFPEVRSKTGQRIFNKHEVKHKAVPGTA